MKLVVNEAVVVGQDVDLILHITATSQELSQTAANYSKRPLTEKIEEQISVAIAKEYLDKNKAKIMEGIDINKILDGVKLKIVEGFSLNR